MAGFHGTANVLAGKRYGIPVFGTMSHSFVMAHESERDAFSDFVASFPTLSTLLVDTYDTIRGVENAAAVAARVREAGVKIQGVRLDSGDLHDLSRKARRILDQAGFGDIAIVASGNLDEYRIADLVDGGAPIDAFGVGTALAVSDDAPSADFVYKLVDYKDRGRLKTSAGKISTPGRKQLFRAYAPSGSFFADLVGIVDEGATTVAREFKPVRVENGSIDGAGVRKRTSRHASSDAGRSARARDERTEDPRRSLQDSAATRRSFRCGRPRRSARW